MGRFESPENIVMSNDNYKLLLKGLFMSTFYDGTLNSLTKIIQTILGYNGKCCIIRKEVNEIEIVSDFKFEDWHKQLFEENIIPIPIGLSYSFRVV